MPVIESRPFLVPAQSAVEATIAVVEPEGPIDDVAKQWVPGHPLRVRARVALDPQFWADTQIPDGECINVVIVGICLSSRTMWRTECEVRRNEDGSGSAEGELELDGDSLAAEVSVDVWVIGPGRTGVGSNAAVHAGAKLWRMATPQSILLDDTASGFPTSAVSFAGTGRKDTQWSVVSPPHAEPHWSISSAVRLYVNTDRPECAELVEGRAPKAVYDAIQSDIHLVVLQRLASWLVIMDEAQMIAAANEDRESLAAFGGDIAGRMGVSLGEAMRLSTEDYSAFIARSRESLDGGVT